MKYIPPEITEAEIKSVFGEVGEIISTRIKPSTKRIDGEDITIYQFGYILYSKVEEA